MLGKIPFTVPSLPAGVPKFSPVFTQFVGKVVAGAAELTVPCTVLICTA